MKQTERKHLPRLLAGTLAVMLLAGCGGGKENPEDTAPIPSDSPSQSLSVENGGWYELDGETGILTVRIPSESAGFDWSFLIDDESVLELLTQETTEDTWVASFRALADGDCMITFSYTKDDQIQEARLLEVHCEGGKVAQVVDDGVVDMSGFGEDDPEITELRETNQLLNVLREHQAVTCVSETWDGEDNWQYKTVTQFTMNNGRLWYDREQYDEADQVTYCEAGYINDDVPGALYMVETGGGKYMEIYLPSEYDAFIAEQWLRRAPGDYELYIDSETDTEYNNTTVTARRVNEITGVTYDVLYFTDSDTGLITGLEITEYSSEDPSQVVSVTRSNVMYDEPRLMEERAAMEILFPEDACYLNVVINPGQDNEEELSYQVAKDTQVEFDALEDYELYFDYACEQPMDWIDMGQNGLTVYVVLK